MNKAIEARSRRVLCGGPDDQHGAPIAVMTHAPASGENALAVFPQSLRAIIRI
jgi:hypothetical protein